MKKINLTVLICLGFIALVVGVFIQHEEKVADMNITASKHKFHHPLEFIQSIKGSPHAGAKVYEAFCSNCHAVEPDISIGAPRIGVHSDWNIRRKKGIDGLLKTTDMGLGNMPPKGGCFECAAKILKSAIEFMLPKSNNKSS